MNLKQYVIFALCALGVCSAAVAGDWPQLEKRLSTWDGVKEVQLPADVDPLEDPFFAPVVELFLREGFAVRAEDENGDSGGLILKRHQGRDGARLVLTRASDGALLALEAVSAPRASKVNKDKKRDNARVISTNAVTSLHRSAVTAEPLHIESDTQVHTLATGYAQGKPYGQMLIEIPGSPRSIVTWSASKTEFGDFHVFALYDAGIVHFCYHSGHLERIAEFAPPVRVSRALRLECSDLDGDGTPELAPVWVEDIYSVDEGTESRLHAWVVDVTSAGGMKVQSADLKGYLALVGDRLYLQKRGAYRVFTSEVYAVEFVDGMYRCSTSPVAQAQHWILNHARWPDNERVLIWNDDQRLVLAARSNEAEKSTSVTGTLLSDFGTYVGASIYVPLEEPEYRSGFSAHDKVMARKVQVPRRLHPHGDSLFTLARGREAGMPLVGKPGGKDKLVQIHAAQTGLEALFPFTPVDAFILDFDLFEKEVGEAGAILLLNEEKDGSGKAYLQVQRLE